MTNSKFNVRLLRRVQKHILKQPQSFSMTDWKMNTECGTELCIGGWAIALHEKAKPDYITETKLLLDNKGYYEDAASAALGISKDEGHILFFSMAWPNKFSVPYYRAKTLHAHKHMALWASKMIDWFIEQKKKGKEVEVNE